MKKNVQLIAIVVLLIAAGVILFFGEKMSEENKQQVLALKTEYEAKEKETTVNENKEEDKTDESGGKAEEKKPAEAVEKGSKEYDFSGKNLVMAGDGVGKDSAFLDKVKSSLNLGSALNKANNGITMTNMLSTVTDDEIKNADIVIVFASINDYTRSTQIGSASDDVSSGTYCGSIKSVINKVKTVNPDVELIFMTQTKHGYIEGQYSYPQANSRGNLLDEYAKAVTEVCSQQNVKVIDLFNESGITSDNVGQYTTNNLNFNDAGNELIANVVTDRLKSIMNVQNSN